MANHVRQIRDGIDVGGIVNQVIVIATALGIIKHKHKTFLSEFCGQIDINRSWGLSLLNRLGYVKRKGTKAERKLPVDFDDQKKLLKDY